MRVLTRVEFDQNKHSMLPELKKTVFIYPTDSIYGIGCDATNQALVQKVRELKNSPLQAFSVIAPNKEWVYENCEVSAEAKPYVEQLGDLAEVEGERTVFSIVLKLKNKDSVAPNVTQGLDTISVRIPKHWFSRVVSELGTPIITTSANPTGGDFMTTIDNLHERIKAGVDHCIYVGEKRGKPSTLIYADKEPISFKKR